MAPPFSVRDQDNPGNDLGEWTENGDITIPGDLTVGGSFAPGAVDTGAITGTTLGLTGAATVGGDITLTGALDIAAGSQVNVGGATSTACLATEVAAAADDVLSSRVTADIVNRFIVEGDGKLRWGPGSGAIDTELYRSAANTLKTDDALVVVGALTAPSLSLNSVNVVNALADLVAGRGATVATAEDTTSLSYTDLATSGPAVSITLAEARVVEVTVTGLLFQVGAVAAVYMSWAASGATTLAAADAQAVQHNGSGNAERYSATGYLSCNAGTTTFTAKYKAGANTARFTNRQITARVLG